MAEHNGVESEEVTVTLKIAVDYHKFCKNKEEFHNLLKATLQNEFYKGDLWGELKSINTN